MRVSTATQSSQLSANQLVAALIRHSGNISPQQAIRAAQSISEEFSLQPKYTQNYSGSPTGSSKKIGKKTKKSKPSKTTGMTESTGFCHVHDSNGNIGDAAVDITFQRDSLDWDENGNRLVLNLSRKQVKRLRASLSAYLYSTQERGEHTSSFTSQAA